MLLTKQEERRLEEVLRRCFALKRPYHNEVPHEVKKPIKVVFAKTIAFRDWFCSDEQPCAAFLHRRGLRIEALKFSYGISYRITFQDRVLHDDGEWWDDVRDWITELEAAFAVRDEKSAAELRRYETKWNSSPAPLSLSEEYRQHKEQLRDKGGCVLILLAGFSLFAIFA
jgi:hypothetical protein